jgi:hypothetical protein
MKEEQEQEVFIQTNAVNEEEEEEMFGEYVHNRYKGS